MKKSLFRRLLWNKYAIFGYVIIVIVLLVFVFSGNGKMTKIEFAQATVGNVFQKVSVTGKVMPVDKADLAFQKSGVVVKINIKVNDQVKRGDVLATLESAGDRANLASAQAKLADISRGLNLEELAVEKSKVNSTETALTNAKQDALNAELTSYVQVSGAISNYADSLFSNPQSANPTINVRTGSQTEQININSGKVTVSDSLNRWKASLDTSSSADDVSGRLLQANKYLSSTKTFLSALSTIVTNLSPGNSGLTQSVIDSHVSEVNSALAALNQALASVASAKSALENASSAYNQAYNNFLLKNSGSSAQSVAAQSATVDSFKAELAKDQIISPMAGLVTKIEPNLGEFVSPGETVMSVISDGDYKIEAYVPEADIAKLALGNLASTTLDAYGQNVDFPATITALDPAETVLEGVPTYKVTLKFLSSDARILPGMTANLDILASQRQGVLTVPARAVTDTNGKKTVRILDSNGQTFKERPVEVGLKGSDGAVEVVSGLTAGERVVTYIK
ncbi:MAG: efflux RND transporter periplasmic adaptor subunit [Candidatus Paceibacterota bacterium]